MTMTESKTTTKKKWPLRLRYFMRGEAKSDFRPNQNTYVDMTGHTKEDTAFINNALIERFKEYNVDAISHGSGFERYIEISHRQKAPEPEPSEYAGQQQNEMDYGAIEEGIGGEIGMITGGIEEEGQ